jgi:ubiquinone/menaquinone biosynthesis C-methylase UbiE
LRFVGDGDFDRIGNEFIGLLRAHGLQPSQRVLDVGCGIGRIAVPLTGYLDCSGSYEGFDIVHHGIVWCRRRISPRFPRFKFTHANIYNKMYNPRGRLAASAYTFPYGDGEFDYAILTSVLTHMLPDDVRHYLRETRRVLKPGGICFATMFLRNAEASELMERGRAHITFRHQLAPGCWVESSDVPEGAVLYEDTMSLDMFRKAGLQPNPPLRGSWCGREKDTTSYQDIIVAARHDCGAER